mmetsp:Transcript_61347/g.142769  ORF Transcript_61347/g.142769 Transcript_61347/m.142769 type:complete len:215 (-) Transcript_61347:82-726(-)
MGQSALGGRKASDDWITLKTDGWEDGDIAWVHGGPNRRDALHGDFLWLLLSDDGAAAAVAQIERVTELLGPTAVHARLQMPTCEAAAEAAAGLVAKAKGRQPAVLFRGDLLGVWGGTTLREVVAMLGRQCRLVLASCGAGSWAFGGKRPWGPHGASHATAHLVEIFCASQPLQCAQTCTVPQLYLDWLMGDDAALEALVKVHQVPMCAILTPRD